MFKDTLDKLNGNPSIEESQRVTRELANYIWAEFKANRSWDAYPDRVDEPLLDTYQAVVKIAGGDDKELILKFACCFTYFSTKGPGFILPRKTYYLLSALRGYHDFNFWISVAKILTEPCCLSVTKDSLPDILAIRNKLGIDED